MFVIAIPNHKRRSPNIQGKNVRANWLHIIDIDLHGSC